MNKLPKEKIQLLEYHGNYDVKNVLKEIGLKYKVDEEIGNTAFSYIFTPKWNKEQQPYNYLPMMNFLIDTLIEATFE